MALDPAVFRGLSGFRSALRRFLAASEAICRASGLTAQQYQVLLAIKAGEAAEMSMGDLAEQLLLTHHAGVQMIDRLAAAGLAARRPSARDRRVVLLQLTPAGEALADELAGQHFEALLRHEPMLRRSLDTLRQIGERAGQISGRRS